MLGTRRTIVVAVSVGKEGIEPEYVATYYRRFFGCSRAIASRSRGAVSALRLLMNPKVALVTHQGADSVERVKT